MYWFSYIVLKYKGKVELIFGHSSTLNFRMPYSRIRPTNLTNHSMHDSLGPKRTFFFVVFNFVLGISVS